MLDMRLTLAGRSSGRAAAALGVLVCLVIGLPWGMLASTALAANCGGTTVCQCGDTVVSNYTMTADLGPCSRLASTDTVGLWLRSGVTLDCQGHVIAGPADRLKDAYGIRVGQLSAPASDVTITSCGVTGFWWGVYVQSSTRIVIDSNHLYLNGWKDPTANGTGYGLDVANSTAVVIRNNTFDNNGNEGARVSGVTDRTIEGNDFQDNGLEQLYLINSDNNFIRNNLTQGGSQGLEMRVSSKNVFSYNVWAGSPLQWLENDDSDNEFFYDSFEGRVVVGPG